MKKASNMAIILLLIAGMLSGCGGKANTKISVISREPGSGTRSAFIELFGVEQKNAAGEKEDYTTEYADVTNNTSVMMTSVSGNPNAIGYISLGSLNDTVKALEIDGTAATAKNIKSGAYKIARPFNIVTSAAVTEAAQAFLNYIMSAEGQKVVEENGYIAIDPNAPAYNSGSPAGKVVVAGSSSVTHVMEKLKEAYALVNPNGEIEVQQSDSSTGMNALKDGICDIGMASRALKDSELAAGLVPMVMAMDGIAVVVNLENTVDGLASEQVRGVFMGEITDWSAIAGS